MAGFISRGFGSRKREREEYGDRLPPGQYVEHGWPVLTAGPTPRIDPDDWAFKIEGMVGNERNWTAAEFRELPFETITRDIHCVTKWSKFDTTWEGVTIDDLFAAAKITPPTEYLLAQSYDGYDTNLPVADLVGGKAMIATRFDGKPLEAEHGGPARLLVPHLYFWKSAKWVKGLRFTARDEAGFWELRGYHMYGDPWREQRYTNDP
jgi:DMSO/TMAO reductase YedYZ molybdopterin-dependent catalytic subunit